MELTEVAEVIYAVTKDNPEQARRSGDYIVIRPGSEQPYTLCRQLTYSEVASTPQRDLTLVSVVAPACEPLASAQGRPPQQRRLTLLAGQG